MKLTIREVRLHVGGYGVLLETADPQHPERPLIIGSCEGRDFTDAEHKAHADLITESVNRYPDLKATLETLVKGYDEGEDVQTLINYINVQCRAVLELKEGT